MRARHIASHGFFKKGEIADICAISSLMANSTHAGGLSVCCASATSGVAAVETRLILLTARRSATDRGPKLRAAAANLHLAKLGSSWFLDGRLGSSDAKVPLLHGNGCLLSGWGRFRNDYGWMALPADVVRQFQELATSIEKRTQIVWAEHCSECAFPSCYATCAFYTPRRDLHCRRFEDGIRQDTVGGIELGKIRLRKWAKLEGVGPARLIDAARAEKREAMDRSVTALITKAPLSQITYARATRYWNQWKSPEQPQAADKAPDAFVLEAWLATGPGMAFTLTILPIGQAQQAFYQRGLMIEPGYNRIVVAQAEIAGQVDITKPYLIQLEPVEEASGRELVLRAHRVRAFQGRACLGEAGGQGTGGRACSRGQAEAARQVRRLGPRQHGVEGHAGRGRAGGDRIRSPRSPPSWSSWTAAASCTRSRARTTPTTPWPS